MEKEISHLDESLFKALETLNIQKSIECLNKGAHPDFIFFVDKWFEITKIKYPEDYPYHKVTFHDPIEALLDEYNTIRKYYIHSTMTNYDGMCHFGMVADPEKDKILYLEIKELITLFLVKGRTLSLHILTCMTQTSIDLLRTYKTVIDGVDLVQEYLIYDLWLIVVEYFCGIEERKYVLQVISC